MLDLAETFDSKINMFACLVCSSRHHNTEHLRAILGGSKCKSLEWQTHDLDAFLEASQ